MQLTHYTSRRNKILNINEVNTIKKTLITLFLFIFNIQIGFSQTTSVSKLVLLNKRNKIIYSYSEGNRVRVITYHDYHKQKFKGILTLISDSTIALDSNTIGLDSIYKIVAYTKTKQVIGHSIATFGTILLIGGAALTMDGIKDSDPVYSFLKTILGTTLTGSGLGFIGVGEKMAYGKARTIYPNRKLKIQ